MRQDTIKPAPYLPTAFPVEVVATCRLVSASALVPLEHKVQIKIWVKTEHRKFQSRQELTIC